MAFSDISRESASPGAPARAPSRVPEVTADFWLIKLLAVTMGETAADFLSINLGFGLTATSLLMAVLFLVALAIQFYQGRYVPWSYWLTVVLISVVGTLVTDNLVDSLGVSLMATTIGFSVALGVTFAIWYGIEGTLSIHSIHTPRREIFYWLAILFTFALGTSVGDQVAESFSLGYLNTGLLFGGIITAIVMAYYLFATNAIVAFWIVYILTRPLGASLGDLLSQPAEYGGLGFGTITTSFGFLLAILATVVYATLRFRHPSTRSSS